jgi:putative transcriptional regulator
MSDVKPLKGDLLIAQPLLNDPNFERSVVLLCEHNEEGSFGFVLNKEADVSVCDLMNDYPYCTAPVYVGGPVEQDTLHFITKPGLKLTGTHSVSKNVNWAGDFAELMLLIQVGKITEDQVRFFVGYSGWGAGQLEEELEEGAWVICKQAASNLVFEIPVEEQWREILKMMGGRFKVMANYPTDPRLN